MKIQVNGQIKELNDTGSLKEVIESFCADRTKVIAELNGTVIKHPEWADTAVKDGDTIELVSFVGGG